MSLRFGLVLGVAGAVGALAACSHTVEGTGSSGSSSSGASGTSGGTSGGGNTLVPIDTARLCKLIVSDCQTAPGITIPECVATFGALRTSADCANKIPTATCTTLPDIELSCFPDCATGTLNECLPNGLITTCGAPGATAAGKLYTFSCDGICRSRGTTWTGSCGETAPDGSETSEVPRCWCE